MFTHRFRMFEMIQKHMQQFRYTLDQQSQQGLYRRINSQHDAIDKLDRKATLELYTFAKP